jgi:hypothetical protein
MTLMKSMASLHQGPNVSKAKPLNISCVPQKTHSQQAMTKVKYVVVPDVK